MPTINLKFSAALLCLLASSALPVFPASAQAGEDGAITWLVEYDGKSLPDATWSKIGAPKAAVADGALHLVDDSAEIGGYRATWQAKPDQEIIVDARVKVVSTTGSVKGKTSLSVWPWRDGAPICVHVSDGRHQDGLVLFPSQATSFTDRFVPLDTTSRFHTYRLIIREHDMSIEVDGERKVEGQGAFWKAADSPEPFIQFGSSAKNATGDAYWEYVRLGVRELTKRSAPAPLKVTIGEPWEIPRTEVKQTRPYLYDLGEKLLMMSVAQGPDAFYEPYGLLKSVDLGQTWTPIEGLDQVPTAPLPVLRRPDGSILAASRWTWLQDDGSIQGKTVRFDRTGEKYEMFDNKISLPARYMPETKSDQLIVERQIFNDDDGGASMVVWSRKLMPISGGRKGTERWSHLVRTTDNGYTWNHVATIGPGGEPAVAQVTPQEWTAVIRGDRNSRMVQVFSHDAGKTWSQPIALEEGKVAPDLVMMRSGVLACSYGRPASCLMFSLDGGKTWSSHHVISDRVGFNYSSIREISPGRLLYVHDAPKLNAVYVDVERLRN